MKYAILNEKTGLWVKMDFTHRVDLAVFKTLYPKFRFLPIDETLHGHKFIMDKTKERKYISDIKEVR